MAVRIGKATVVHKTKILDKVEVSYPAVFSRDFVLRPAAENGIGHVALGQIRADGLAHCRLTMGAALALLVMRLSFIPHKVIDKQHSPIFKHIA